MILSTVELIAKRVLLSQKLNKYELADEARCDQRTAQRILKRLHAERFVRISEWDVCYRAPIPRYALGAGKDATRPVPLDKNIVQRRRRRNPEVRWDEAMDKRKKRALEKVKIHAA